VDPCQSFVTGMLKLTLPMAPSRSWKKEALPQGFLFYSPNQGAKDRKR
jgi:hypothetical protein